MKFCTTCGKEIEEGTTVCPNCGCPTAPITPVTPAEPTSPLLQEKKSVPLMKILNIAFNGVGIFSGLLSILFAFVARFGGKTLYYVSSSSYGGDAYTGIQNAAATTANNLKSFDENIGLIASLIFIVAGLALIAFLPADY